jgi:hypothetical protein
LEASLPSYFISAVKAHSGDLMGFSADISVVEKRKRTLYTAMNYVPVSQLSIP